MNYMFSNCSRLTLLDVSKFNTTNVTEMVNMFANCSGVSSLNVSGFNTANVIRMDLMFYNCNGLSVLDLSSFNTGRVTNIGYMFYGCSHLQTIYISDMFVTNQIQRYEDIQDETFSGCTLLVGGAGTEYDSNHTDISYARIDGGVDNPGYFTRKS